MTDPDSIRPDGTRASAKVKVGGRDFTYDERLLPHPYLGEIEAREVDPDFKRLVPYLTETGPEAREARKVWRQAAARWLTESEYSIGYPGWNLLYFSLLCSIHPRQTEAVVIETGTNRGLSTIVMAQALKELEIEAKVETVELDEGLVEIAKAHVDRAGLSDFVSFNVADSLDFLSRISGDVHFALIDDLHEYDHVVKEIDIICPKIASQGKAYFDNAGVGEVKRAMEYLRETHGGSLLEFPNCSWRPPGNAIWQPDASE
jgi:predicted O-methyltransferase YrrM